MFRMPRATTPVHATDLDYDLAFLPHQHQLDGDSLDALSDVIDARNAARDTLALLQHMQSEIERGGQPYRTREQFAVDLEQATDTLRRHVAAILGADGAVY